jgi:hypothetical protein
VPAKPETRLVWRPLKRSKCLLPLDAQRVENDCVMGYPDVEMIGCTMELKYEPKYPKRPTTKVNIKSLTKNPAQRAWWERRARKGGRVYVLLRIEDDWLIFDGVTASKCLCYSTKSELFEKAIRVWEKRLKGNELCQILSCQKD